MLCHVMLCMTGLKPCVPCCSCATGNNVSLRIKCAVLQVYGSLNEASVNTHQENEQGCEDGTKAKEHGTHVAVFR